MQTAVRVATARRLLWIKLDLRRSYGVQPRNGLTVRASPRSWRRSDRLLECAGEGRLGVVADNLGDLRERRAGGAEPLSRDLHAPIGEVVHRRDADQTNEAVGQCRAR